MKIDTVTDVHLAYEMAGKEARASQDYHRALRAALTGMDPHKHMREDVLEHYNDVRTHKHTYLPQPATQIRLRARMLATKGSDVTAKHLHDVCGVQLSACEFYEHPDTRAVDHLVLARTLGDLVYELCKLVHQEFSQQETDTQHKITKLCDAAHTVNVADPEDSEYKHAKAELIELSAYFDKEDTDA